MHRTPAVYAWKRGDKWLYIGSTYCGMNRLTDTKHDVLSKQEIRATDTILIMYNLTLFQARRLESKLIKEHKPKYNNIRYSIPIEPKPVEPKIRKPRRRWRLYFKNQENTGKASDG